MRAHARPRHLPCPSQPRLRPAESDGRNNPALTPSVLSLSLSLRQPLVVVLFFMNNMLEVRTHPPHVAPPLDSVLAPACGA